MLNIVSFSILFFLPLIKSQSEFCYDLNDCPETEENELLQNNSVPLQGIDSVADSCIDNFKDDRKGRATILAVIQKFRDQAANGEYFEKKLFNSKMSLLVSYLLKS